MLVNDHPGSFTEDQHFVFWEIITGGAAGMPWRRDSVIGPSTDCLVSPGARS